MMVPSSDPIIEAEADAVTLALDLQDAQQAMPKAAMGANQSHPDVGKDLRSAAQQIRGQNSGRLGGTQSKSAGKLQKPSSKARPTSAKAVPMRRLGRPVNTRKSVYDVAGSPEKLTLLPQVVHHEPISPLRRQKKARPAEEQPKRDQSPRRSGRAQGLQVDEAGPDAAQSTSSIATAQEQALPDANFDDEIYRDHFPDYVVQRHFPLEIAASADADEEEDLVSDGKEDQEQATAESVQPVTKSTSKGGTPQKKKRGRPRKSAKASDAALASRPHVPSPVVQDPIPEYQTLSSARAQRRLAALHQHSALGEALQPAQSVETRQEPLPTDAAEASARQQSRRGTEEQVQEQPATQTKKHSRGRPRKGQERVVNLALRRSSRHEQAVTKLNERRNATGDADPGGGPGNSRAAPLEGEQEGEDANKDELPNKPIIPRISEVRFSTAADGDVSEDIENGTAQASIPSESKKRKKPSQPTQANTGAKRRKTAIVDDDEYEEADEQQPREERAKANQRRLWGQWLPLKRVRRDLKNVGCNTEDGELMEQNEMYLGDDDVKATVELCNEAMQRFQQLKDGNAEDSEPASVLEDIGHRVDGLRGRNENFPTNFKDKTKTTNIYSHLIPALVKLVWQAVECYLTLDEDDLPAGQISMNHLRNIQALISLTLELEQSVKKQYKARPDTSNAVVRPVHNGIAVPLRNIFKAFQNVMRRHRADVRANQLRQQEAQDRALRLEQEERRNRQAAELSRMRKKWEQLHLERMAAEGGLMRPQKMTQLQMPDPNLDVDANGMIFRRVSLFHPRVGPPPGRLNAAKDLIWTEGELRALTDGLRVYAGPMVYEKLFRAWCPKGRILNKYNVMEIVAAAENVKMYYEKELGDAAEEWVKAIPVWSKGHAVGEENEDSLVDADEAVGGGAAAVAAASSS